MDSLVVDSQHKIICPFTCHGPEFGTRIWACIETYNFCRTCLLKAAAGLPES